MKIDMYDDVLLKDGRRADVVEILDEEKGVYLADYHLGQPGEEDWYAYEQDYLYREDIEKVVKKLE